MNNKDFKDSYGIKEVPDIFICDEEGEILYYSTVTKKMKLSQQANSCLWEGECEIAIGNLETWFNICHDSRVKDIYFRTWKRSKETGEDVPFAIAISGIKFHDFEICLKPDADPFTFPIKFAFAIGNLRIVTDENAPNVITSVDKNGNTIKTFINPAQSLKQLKIKEIKEKINNMKRKRAERLMKND